MSCIHSPMHTLQEIVVTCTTCNVEVRKWTASGMWIWATRRARVAKRKGHRVMLKSQPFKDAVRFDQERMNVCTAFLSCIVYNVTCTRCPVAPIACIANLHETGVRYARGASVIKGEVIANIFMNSCLGFIALKSHITREVCTISWLFPLWHPNRQEPNAKCRLQVWKSESKQANHSPS